MNADERRFIAATKHHSRKGTQRSQSFGSGTGILPVFCHRLEALCHHANRRCHKKAQDAQSSLVAPTSCRRVHRSSMRDLPAGMPALPVVGLVDPFPPLVSQHADKAVRAPFVGKGDGAPGGGSLGSRASAPFAIRGQGCPRSCAGMDAGAPGGHWALGLTIGDLCNSSLLMVRRG